MSAPSGSASLNQSTHAFSKPHSRSRAPDILSMSSVTKVGKKLSEVAPRHRFAKPRNMQACARCADMRKRCNMEAPYSAEGCEECTKAGVSICPPHRPRRARRTQKPYARPEKPSVSKPAEDASIIPKALVLDNAKRPVKTTRSSLPIPSSSRVVSVPDVTLPRVATAAQDAELDFPLGWPGIAPSADVRPFVHDSGFSFGPWDHQWEPQYHVGLFP
ncbi:hypothetical protein M0805_003665 [Coniferiporia weirii]|nr:hypothetical protein M0805_003665 [Coniferiporia weirii]